MVDSNQAQEKGKKEEISELEALANEAYDFGKVVVGTIPIVGTTFYLPSALPLVGSFPLGHFIETKISRNPEEVKLNPGTFAKEGWVGLALAPAVLGGLKVANVAPKAFGLEGAVSSAFGYTLPLSTLAVGATTFGLLTLGLPLLYYPVSHILNEGKIEGMWTDLKKNYFKHPTTKTALNTISSLAVMDAYSGYTWTNYLATNAASYLTSFLAPYLTVPPIALLGLGIGALAVGYRLALSRHDLNYFKILNPLNWTPLPEMVSGAISVLYKGIKGFFKGTYETGRALGFHGSPAPQRAPQPAP